MSQVPSPITTLRYPGKATDCCHPFPRPAVTIVSHVNGSYRCICLGFFPGSAWFFAPGKSQNPSGFTGFYRNGWTRISFNTGFLVKTTAVRPFIDCFPRRQAR